MSIVCITAHISGLVLPNTKEHSYAGAWCITWLIDEYDFQNSQYSEGDDGEIIFMKRAEQY